MSISLCGLSITFQLIDQGYFEVLYLTTCIVQFLNEYEDEMKKAGNVWSK